jgi:hypothetical protein
MGKWIGPNSNFIDRVSLGIVTTNTVDITWKSMARKLGQVRKTIDNNSRAPNSKETKLGIEGLLLDDSGKGGLTNEDAIVEQLFAARPQESFLLCIPRKIERSKTNPLFETTRKFCDRYNTLFSTYSIEQKGEYIQCPIQLQSNPCGPKIVSRELDYIQVLQSNHNPCLVVQFFGAADDRQVLLETMKIYFTDVLLKKVSFRYIAQARTIQFSHLFSGASPTTYLRNNVPLFNQLIIEEIRGDGQLTCTLLSDFEIGYMKLEKKKKNRARSKQPDSLTVDISTTFADRSGDVVEYVQGEQDSELLEVGPAYKVLKVFDDKIKAFILDFPGKWTSLSIDPLVADIGPLIEDLKRVAPFTWSSTRICRAPNSYAKRDVKERMQLLHLIGLVRKRYSHLLPQVGLIFSFAGMARGLSSGPHELGQALSLKTSNSNMYHFMKNNRKEFCEKPEGLFKSYRCLSLAFDNYQRGQEFTEQRHMQSN